MDLLTAALAWHDAGACVLPAAKDGTKRPAVNWKQYQQQRPTRDDVEQLLTGADGIGLVCGAVSGGIEMFELEGRAVTEGLAQQLKTLLADHGYADLWTRITTGYTETTPSGGVHYLYRVIGDAEPRGNTKLARRPATPAELEENPREKVKVLIETRGEGGWVVIAPSAGATHPTSNAWTRIIGAPDQVATITAEERDALYAIATMLDAMLARNEPAAPAATGILAAIDATPAAAAGTRPGDDYNARASWDEILTPHGWTRAGRMGPGYAWVRPGKHARDGISATTGQAADGIDRLYVFSSSTEFDTETPYSKFAAYAVLEHDGDYKAATKQLAKDGYGEQKPAKRELTLASSNPNPQPATNGNTALKVAQDNSDVPRKIHVTLTDHGNAELLVDRHSDRLKYVPARGKWIRWDGGRWAWCADDSVAVQAAVDTIHAIDPDDSDEAKHKARSLSRRSLESAVALARRNAAMQVDIDKLDTDPWVLNTPSGVVDLRTGHLQPSTPSTAVIHTRITGAAYDPATPAPRWQQFLRTTFGDDDEMIGFIQRLAGYSATGAVTHHVLPFLHGAGGNGKSVFLNTLMHVLGDYASPAPASFLMEGRNDENAVARLAGLRLVVCSEVSQRARFNEEKVKLLTGGDKITARFLFQEHFTFTPTHHLWLMGNHQPRVEAGGESFWRRLRLLPFTRVVPKAQRIDTLEQQLVSDEAEGILAWIVEGSIAALRDGLAEPDSVLEATQAYAEEEDALARFVSERIHVGGGEAAREVTSDVRTAYAAWCRDEGEQEISPQMFGRELRTRFGIHAKRSHGRRYYVGMTLFADPATEPESHWSDR